MIYEQGVMRHDGKIAQHLLFKKIFFKIILFKIILFKIIAARVDLASRAFMDDGANRGLHLPGPVDRRGQPSH
jgi:hypothetical protein